MRVMTEIFFLFTILCCPCSYGSSVTHGKIILLVVKEEKLRISCGFLGSWNVH